MKLLYCKGCQDMVRPLIGIERSCQCGLSKIVAHADNITIQYSGKKAVIIGINNSSFIRAIHNQPESGKGEDFIAFVIPKKCDSVKFKE